MISALLTQVGTCIGYVVTLIGGAFTSVTELIYVSTGTNTGLTTFGELLCVSMAFNIFYFVLRWIRGLIRPGV